MSEWVRVNQDELNSEPQTETIGGVSVNVFFSPYDAPDWVRGRFDEKTNRFVFEFRYLLQDEKTKLIKQGNGNGAYLRVGVETDRLHAVEFDVDAVPDNRVTLNLLTRAEETLKKVVRKGRKNKNRRRSNFRAVKKAFDLSTEVLQKSLVCQ